MQFGLVLIQAVSLTVITASFHLRVKWLLIPQVAV
jgi:hypothetical protein